MTTGLNYQELELIMNSNENIEASSGPSDEEKEELYLGEFLVRTEFFTKECFDRLILLEAKIGVMTEVMMSLRDLIHSYMEIDDDLHTRKPN